MFWLIIMIIVAVTIGCVVSTFPDRPNTGYGVHALLPPEEFNRLFADDED